MKTIKFSLILIVFLFVASCSNTEKGVDSLVGGWGYSGDTLIQFTKQDTTILGVLNRETSNNGTQYASGSVLFKDIKKTSDSTFTAKGLFIKPVYRTEKVFVQSMFYHIPDRYEDRQVFDHNESVYVDYRLEINRNFHKMENVICSKLNCIPFSEGPKWEFIGKLNPEQNKLLDQELMRIADSIRISDSINMAEAEQKRLHERELEKSKKAQELLK